MTSCTGYAIAHNLTPFISMQNHPSLLYREEEREMLPLLKVSPDSPCQVWTLSSDHSNVQLESPAPRRWMHPVESLGERYAHSSMGRDQRAGDGGYVGVQHPVKKHLSLIFHSWSGIYRGNNGSEAVVRRFVTSQYTLLRQTNVYPLSVSRS